MLRGTNSRSFGKKSIENSRSIGKPFVRGVLVVLVFMFISGVFSYAANVKYHDLGRDPMRVKVKKIIPFDVRSTIKSYEILSDFLGWTHDGRYIMMKKNGSGMTSVYTKNGKHVIDIKGFYRDSSKNSQRIITLKGNDEYLIYDTKNWNIIKQFKKGHSDKVIFYENPDFLILLENYLLDSGKSGYESKIIKYNIFSGDKDVLYKQKNCGRIQTIVYVPKEKILFRKYDCKKSMKNKNLVYVLDIITKKLKNSWKGYLEDSNIYELFNNKKIYESYDSRLIDLNNLKTIYIIKYDKNVNIDKNLLIYKNYRTDLWSSSFFPNGKLLLCNYGTFRRPAGDGDYPLDAFIFICNYKNNRAVLKLKNPTVLPDKTQCVSPEGDRFVAIEDYKRFVIAVLERR